MSVGLLFGLVVLLLGYALLFKMVMLWQGQPAAWRDILFTGCPQ